MSPQQMRRVNRLWIAAYVMIALCFGTILYVNEVRKDDQRHLIECLNAQNVADQKRTSAISGASEAERAAEEELLRNPGPAARSAVLAAYENTRRIRAANPAPPVSPCR